MAIAASGMGPAFVGAQAPQEPVITEQTVTSWPAASNPFNAKTQFVRIHTDSICSIAFGQSPSATTSNKRLAANQTEFFGVTAGMSVSVIANT